MKTIQTRFAAAKKLYDKGNPSLDACIIVASACMEKLHAEAALSRYGDYRGTPDVEYWVAISDAVISRPFRPEMVVLDTAEFASCAAAAKAELAKNGKFNTAIVDRFIYSAVTSFCLVFDLWKPKSRKTPGTFFEVLMGSICLDRYPGLSLGKHIQITNAIQPDLDEVIADLGEDVDTEESSVRGDSVSTDLVIHNEQTEKGAVIPLKITTRERIVQPFAHQRILESAYPGKFKSFLACISEVQRSEKKAAVEQICVPGTVALFQRHLAQLSGLYYCDIPQRYARQDMKPIIAVKPFSEIFSDIENWLYS